MAHGVAACGFTFTPGCGAPTCGDLLTTALGAALGESCWSLSPNRLISSQEKAAPAANDSSSAVLEVPLAGTTVVRVAAVEGAEDGTLEDGFIVIHLESVSDRGSTEKQRAPLPKSYPISRLHTHSP